MGDAASKRRGEGMTCWSCMHYRVGAWCALRSRKAIDLCQDFDREPGSDEEECNGNDTPTTWNVSLTESPSTK